ncbi:hypothetical protein OFN61_27975, partial [Escherichia coli]|nr:hypothetical protein [Escherichia coli]
VRACFYTIFSSLSVSMAAASIPKNKTLIFIFGKSHFPSSQQGFSYNPIHPIALSPDSTLVDVLGEVNFE